MAVRAYISNIARGWPVAKQEAILADWVPGWPNVTVFRDILDARTRQAHQAVDLVNRAAMLRPTSSKLGGEVIYVASLAVLAWSKSDFTKVLSDTARRGATIQALDGADVPSAPGFMAAKVEGSRRQARQNGTRIAADRRAAEAEAKAMPFKERWRDKTERTADLLAEMGLSRNTASKYLGRRELVLKRVEAQLKRKARDEQAAAD